MIDRRTTSEMVEIAVLAEESGIRRATVEGRSTRSAVRMAMVNHDRVPPLGKTPSRSCGNSIASPNAASHRQSPEGILPPLKWVGGKRWQLPYLRRLWEPESSRRLVEPFCGALAVALGLQPAHAVLNDLNPHVINFYRWVKRGLSIEIVMQNASADFYTCRERFNTLLACGSADTAEAASLFYYLNKTGFNGLCRFNQKGQFNVPFGTFKSVNYRKEFSEYKESLAHWDLVSGDFETLSLDSDDFVYADPPYDVDFTRYARQVFGWEDQIRLARWLACHPGPVVLSNQATGRIVNLYRSLGYKIKLVDAPRSVSCNGNRNSACEVLATRNVTR